MSITFPRSDVLSTVGFEQQVFDLTSLQEFSRQASGVTRGKDLGPALWFASYTTSRLDFRQTVDFEAILNSLDGVTNPFYAYDLRRPYPAAYPDGDFVDSGKIKELFDDKRSLRLKELPAGFQITRGDYLAFDYGDSRALHQAMETIQANGSGDTAAFEVRPHIRDGASVGAAVIFKKASGLFTLEPRGKSSSMRDVVSSTTSFRCVQYL